MSDLVTFGDVPLMLFPRGKERIETTDALRVGATGTESTVAVTAGRLGIDTTLLSKLPATPLGRRAVAHLRGNGIETEIAWDEGGRAALTFFERGARPRESTILDDREGAAVETATPGELAMETVQSGDAVFVGARTAIRSETLTETCRAILRAGGNETAVLGLGPRLALDDAGRERLVDLFSAVDVLVTPRESAESLLARSDESRELGHAIAAEWDFDTVVVSRGRQGAVAVEGSTIHERDGVESDDVDPTGQHAALAGAFLGRRLAGDDVATALTRGVVAGALMRTIPGPTPTIDPAAVEAIVADFERGQGF